jgi:hypothetical protein
VDNAPELRRSDARHVLESITFTPGSASDWLVLTNGQYTSSADSVSQISRIERSGEASSSVPEARREMIAAGESTRRNQVSLARIFSLGASSNTFAEQGAETAADVTRQHSRVFAMNRKKFRNHVFAYTEADTSLSATNYATNLGTLSITPDVTGDVWARSLISIRCSPTPGWILCQGGSYPFFNLPVYSLLALTYLIILLSRRHLRIELGSAIWRNRGGRSHLSRLRIDEVR